LGEDIYDVELFKKGLNNMMAGGGFTVLIPRCQRIPNKQRIGSCQLIYSDIMGGSAKESQLGASLAAEVLRDQRHVAEIFKLGNLKQRWIT
jgi:hypothetical protein